MSEQETAIKMQAIFGCATGLCLLGRLLVLLLLTQLALPLAALALHLASMIKALTLSAQALSRPVSKLFCTT